MRLYFNIFISVANLCTSIRVSNFEISSHIKLFELFLHNIENKEYKKNLGKFHLIFTPTLKTGISFNSDFYFNIYILGLGLKN